MKIKVIILLLVLGTVLLSGCVGNEQPLPGKNTTPTESVTSEVNATPGETETPTENATAGESVTSEVNATPVETMTPEENITQGVNVISTTGGSNTYLIRLANYRATPSSLEIVKGDTVGWRNLQDNPKRSFTLVSQEGLFNNTNLVYAKPFAYTFNETGDYNFTVIGQPRMNVSISVAAS